MNEFDCVSEYCRKRDEIVLSDPESKLFSPRSTPIFYSAFYDSYNRYILALNHEIKMLRRHIRSLRAWTEVEQSHLDDLEGTVWGCILSDYVEPTVRSAIDLPKEIKDKIYQATWKLSIIAQSGAEGAMSIEEIAEKNTSKYKLFEAHGMKSPELDCLRECLDALHGKEHIGANLLEKLHGEKHHDILSPIHMGYPYVRVKKDASSGMIVVHHAEDRLDWHSLIPTIDAQRVLAQKAYVAFHDYAEKLISSGLHFG
ncbi:hypothetical protein [Olsenella sp. An285]|uniref:hypothetical protein n=1 Tax=Olsenella sp. An285 TaxID=1965621 RepID=UPI00117D3CAA|nr:hypothetical protein [Olsenella sp. An285]